MNAEFLAEFASPPSAFRGAPFWAWNGRLEAEELRRQVRLMRRMGLGGFFMHSRVGLATPYLAKEWFDCVGACVDEAERLDMQAWLYDEDRWPSGAAGGLVTRDPRHRQRSLVLRAVGAPRDLAWDEGTLAAFTAKVHGTMATGVRRIGQGRRPARLGPGECILVLRVETAPPSSWYNGYTYLDTLSHEAVRAFLRTTHEAYARRLGPALGRRVPGIFTDEPNYGHMMDRAGEAGPCAVEPTSAPWTPRLPQVFRRRYGYDLLPHLVEVFLDVDGRRVCPARQDYHDCVTHLFVDAFARQIGEWCERHGCAHTGHVLEEQTLSSQTHVVGSAMRFYEYMQAPGIDILTEYAREYDTAKQVSSVARQFGRRWRLTETYGCTGWDFPFAGHKAVGDWQAALGINLRCPHLAWYTMEGEAKRDYPASIFTQSPWWEAYAKVEDYFARIHVAMTRGSEVRDVLVIHPVESLWALSRAGWREDPAVAELNQSLIDLRDTLLAAHLDFDYGDEEMLGRHGRVAKAGGRAALRVGRAAYTAVVVPPMLTVRETTLALLDRFRRAGGAVVFAGDVSACVGARFSTGVAELAAACVRAPAKGPGLARAVGAAGRRVSIADARGRELRPALYLLREDREAFYLFVANTGHDFTRGLAGTADRPVRERTAALPDVRIRGFAGCAGRPVELDPETGERRGTDSRRTADGWEVRTSLPPIGSRLFVFPRKKTAAAPPPPKARRTVRRRRLGGRWDVRLSEANVVVLDRPRYRLGDGPWRGPTEVLQADRAVRESVGVAPRGGAMVQPWARPPVEKPRRTTVTLAYTFQVRALPGGDLALAMERPDVCRVAVNGLSVSADAEAGWWVDRSLRKLPIDPACLRLGRNEIVVTCDYDETHPGLEMMYLLGAFGVQVRGAEVTLAEGPTTLKVGDWTRQGLAFYSGNVTYETMVRVRPARGERLVVAVPKYLGVAVRVLVDGRPAGLIAWPPNELDITDFLGGDAVRLGLEVLGHRRNSHGPLHLKDPYPRWTGPGNYGVEREDYHLKACGLMAPPELHVRR